MKARVLLNKSTNYLHITTTAYIDDNLIELFSSQSNYDISISINFCKIFCQGYLRGNTGVKVNNSINDFK